MHGEKGFAMAAEDTGLVPLCPGYGSGGVIRQGFMTTVARIIRVATSKANSNDVDIGVIMPTARLVIHVQAANDDAAHLSLNFRHV